MGQVTHKCGCSVPFDEKQPRAAVVRGRLEKKRCRRCVEVQLATDRANAEARRLRKQANREKYEKRIRKIVERELRAFATSGLSVEEYIARNESPVVG